ncbi:uncharacterized protein LOC144652419 [Oculina patagonica]
MARLSFVVVLFLFVCYVNSTSVTDPFVKDPLSCKIGECGVNKVIRPPSTFFSRVPHHLLEFLKHQVPNVAPQSRTELEFSAVWLFDEEFHNIKTTDFKYIPQGPKGPTTPLLDTNHIVSPTSAKMQNYIVARKMDTRHPPEKIIHKQVTLNGALRSYKQAKSMLMYTRLRPTVEDHLKICHMKKMLKLPVIVVYSIPRRNITTKNLTHLTHLKKLTHMTHLKDLVYCGIRMIQLPPRLPITLAKPTGVKEVKPMPNIDYIFHGYNFLYGNPIVDPKQGRDPGVSRMPIFKATFDRGLTTSDQRYLIPDGMSFLKAVSCRVDFSSLEDRNEKSYIDSLANTVGAGVSFLGFGFKASTTVQHKTEELRKVSYSYVNTEAVCSVYTGAVFMDMPPKPSDEFVSSLKKCEVEPTDDNFRKLIDNYGTHFLTDVVMGSKFGEESKIVTDQYEKMVSEGVDVGTAAGYSGRYAAGVTTETSSEKQQRERFESARTSKTTYSYGSNIPPDGDADTWASKSSDDPMPINMDITALSELMTEEFLGDTGIDYQKLKKPLIDYLTQYCSKLVDEGKAKDCMPPTEFATNGPGLKKWVTTDSQVSGLDMIDQNTMAMVYGNSKKGWKLSIRKFSEELASKQLIDKDSAYDMVVCRGSRRLGVLITDTYTYGRIEMYQISADGKTITKEKDIDLLTIGMTKKDIGFLFYNSLSYYADVNGFLLAKQQADWAELWKIENICIPSSQVTARRILNLNPGWANSMKTAFHLSDMYFAMCTLSGGGISHLKVVEVISESTYNDSIADFKWSGPLFCVDLVKDDRDTLVALGAQIQYGVGSSMMSAFRWLKEKKKLEFGSHLLTDDYLKDGSELGVVSVYGNMVYLAEEGWTDTGKVMEYQFRYE